MPPVPTAAPPTDFDQLVERVRAIGKEVVLPAASSVDADARFPTEAFDAFKAQGLLSAYVPTDFGGMGLSMTQVCRLCEILGHYCASTAMVFAMHQIQVASIVHHGTNSPFFQSYLRRIVDEQLLLASATTEIGTGGDLTQSRCSIERDGDSFTLEKKAPVISYALHSDAILATARRSPEAESNDQVLVVIETKDTELTEIAGWDTLGFRGTCSLGFVLKSSGSIDQVIPAPFTEVLDQSQHPFAHLTWSSLWLGMATSAVGTARGAVRKKIVEDPDTPPVSALRLSEIDELLFEMRSGLYSTIREYQELLDAGSAADAFSGFGFNIRVNNVKITSSELVVDIVGGALRIVGISGYKNDSKSSLARPLRDAYGAALMVNNDRIRGHNAAMQAVYRHS